MNKELKKETILQSTSLNRFVWIVFLAITSAVCFIFTQNISAQVATNSADPVQKYSISFPVSTLGNCESLAACKEYCEDSAHQEACTNFAKSKGFYKEPAKSQGAARQRVIMLRAKEELGCSSEQECKEICKEEENREKCAAFAKKYSLVKEVKKAANGSVLEKAKSELGCSDEASCKALCQEEANREKCSSFAKKAGLSGGLMKMASMSAKEKKGFEEVKKTVDICKENPEACAKNFEEVEKQILEKGDEYCKSNPAKCREMMSSLSKKEGSGSAGASRTMKERPSEPKVQGVSKTPSFFDWFFNVFLK